MIHAVVARPVQLLCMLLAFLNMTRQMNIATKM